MKLVFKSLKYGLIFQSDYEQLKEERGTIEFKHLNTPGGIAVIYAPNGVGKSSFAKMLNSETSTSMISFLAESENGKSFNPESKAFHVILDQINRNIIRGKETDYLIGAQIQREYELRESIDSAFVNAFNMLAKKYKTGYKVSRVGDYLLSQIAAQEGDLFGVAYGYIKGIVNSKEKGTKIPQAEFIDFIRGAERQITIGEYEESKKEWLITQISGNVNIVEQILSIQGKSIVPNVETVQIEKDDDAIAILKKYQTVETCIVCDNCDYNSQELLTRKTENRKRIYDSLDDKTKEILDNIISKKELLRDDPFAIRQSVSALVKNGETTPLIALQDEIKTYIHIIASEMVNELFHCFDGTHLFADYAEYQDLVKEEPKLDSEELLFIEEIISENIGKAITIAREAEGRNYKLKIGGKDLLETPRDNMELSTGEQNFISLAFELLLARHSDKEYVVIDDPISSFDSIYKNKIAYCIIKFLEEKRQIVLTHNTDLVRLLNVQLNKCFNLYILNNVEGGDNGFIPVSDLEKNMLINLHELIMFFRNKDNRLADAIHDKRQFLMSMIPFMRGYAHICPGLDDYGRLSTIMHGYTTETVDVAEIYKKLFDYDLEVQGLVSAADVLGLNCDELNIIDKEQYPLLATTLEQTLVYYHLRMLVEKELVEMFNIPAHDEMLSQIINKAFPKENDDNNLLENRRLRVFFNSRKTLLNEFNHFEGNMNIFQPAIDISYPSLKKEISDIKAKIEEARILASRLN